MTLTTTLGRMCPSDGFVHSLTRCFEANASIARQAMDNSSFYAERHVAALNELAEYVATLQQSDPVFNCLWLVQSSHGDNDTFTPGEKQTDLLARLGMGPETPKPETSLVELAGAGIEDMLTEQAGRMGPGERALARVQELEPLTEQLRVAHQRISEVESELEASRDETRRAVEQRDYLRTQVGRGTPDDGKPSAKPAKRRKERRKVDGQQGVYFHETERGVIYEIGWTENGQQRWERIGPSLDQAIEERAKRTSNPAEVAA